MILNLQLAQKKIMAVLLFIISTIISAHAQQPVAMANSPRLASLAVVAPAVDCESLASVDISAAIGAPTHITSAKAVENGKPASYCAVLGYVEPQIKFEVRLPLKNWTQRFVQGGCGGTCGSIGVRIGNANDCFPATNGEVALASTDMGHSGRGMEFGDDNQQRIDFAYRSIHVTNLAAKALIEKFYGKGPQYSYFSGCSDGGREGLMEAQRYPKDFNGIIAGAAAMHFTTMNTIYHGWPGKVNTAADGKPILTGREAEILHKAVLAQCDAEDGVTDGLVSNPVACHFDPSVTACKPGQDAATCLGPEQVRVAREIYAGAHDSEGNKLAVSGPLVGSELDWAGLYVPATEKDSAHGGQTAIATMKYLVYKKNPTGEAALADLKFDRKSFEAITELSMLYDSTNPDLKAFATAGGKLIVFHGLADPGNSALNDVSYFNAVGQVMGQAARDKFMRLYLLPGMGHCGGGEGPNSIDLLSPMMAWVESGIAPNGLIASHISMGAGGLESSSAAPPKAGRTRPIFPYPYTAKYTGTGSIDDAKNFVQGPAQPVPADRLKWLGDAFYSSNHEAWCAVEGTAMKCTANNRAASK